MGLKQRISNLSVNPKKVKKVKKMTKNWTLVASMVGPVRMPGLPNAFYVSVYRDPKNKTEYVTGGFTGAYVLP